MSKRLHTFPPGDLREHVTDDGVLCPCMPRVKCDGKVVLHNSYDGRELGEVMYRAVHLLGQALAAHYHDWTRNEIEAYEHALLLIRHHYPKT